MISIHSFKHIVQQITDITDRPACSLLCVCVGTAANRERLCRPQNVVGRCFEHRKPKCVSDAAFADVQSLGNRLGGEVVERARATAL